MKQISNIMLFIILASILLIQTGCGDYQEIENRTTVMGIAFDKGDGNSNYKVSVQIPIATEVAAGGGDEENEEEEDKPAEGTEVITVNADSFSDAKQKIQDRVNGNLFFGHTRLIMFSHELAEDDLKPILSGIRRQAEIRRTVHPVIVKTKKALDMLKYNPKLEQIPMMYFVTMIENERKAKKIPDLSLGRFFIDRIHPGRSPRMISFDVNKDHIQLSGLAVFKSYSLIGYLNNRETYSWLRITENAKGGEIKTNLKNNGRISISPDKVKVRHSYNLQDDTVNIAIKVTIKGTVDEITSNTNARKHRRKIESIVEEHLAKESNGIIKKAQNKYKTDIFNFGQEIRAYHYRDIWKKINWDRDFPKADIDVHYRVNLSGITQNVD